MESNESSKKFRGRCFIDKPHHGSIFLHNQTTSWNPRNEFDILEMLIDEKCGAICKHIPVGLTNKGNIINNIIGSPTKLKLDSLVKLVRPRNAYM